MKGRITWLLSFDSSVQPSVRMNQHVNGGSNESAFNKIKIRPSFEVHLLGGEEWTDPTTWVGKTLGLWNGTCEETGKELHFSRNPESTHPYA